jgi:hypothetical protein
MRMRAVIFACLLFASVSADAARRPSRYVPGVAPGDEREQDPDRQRDPKKRDLHHYILHLQDLITDRDVKHERVHGLEYFMERLQLRLKKHGTDKPRWDILLNAHEAWEILRQGRDAMREAYLPLFTAQSILLEVYGTLDETVTAQEAGAQISATASEEMQTVIDGIISDAEPPQSAGPEAQTADLHSIEEMEPYLTPLEERIEEASRKLQLARTRIATARQLVYIVNTFAERATDLDAEAVDSLATSRTARTTRSVWNDDSSHVHIDRTNRWLEQSAKRAKKIHKKMQAYVKPGDGKLRKAVADALAADASLLGTKQAGLEGGEVVNGAHRVISRDIRAAWQEMQQMPEGPIKEARKSKLKEQAEKTQEQAAGANGGVQQANALAAQAVQKSITSKDLAGKDLRKIYKLLGEGDPEEHTDIVDYDIYVEPPKNTPRLAGSKTKRQKKIRSKPLKYPKVLNDDPNNVIRDQYGEGDIGLAE